MNGHKRNLVVAALLLFVVHIGQEHNILQPLLHGGLLGLLALAIANLRLALLRKELHRVQQLLDVIYRARRLGRILQTILRKDSRT